VSEAEATDQPKNKGGRPSIKTPDLLKEFCRRIAGGRSVANVCKDEDMPEDRAIWRWLSEDETFSRDYARAIQARAMAHADMISDVTFGILSGKIPPDRGRVALDAMKWTASRLLPKIYGDRQQVDVEVQHTHTLHLKALRALSNMRSGNESGYIEGQAIDITDDPTFSGERQDQDRSHVNSTHVNDLAQIGSLDASLGLDPPGGGIVPGAGLAPPTSTATPDLQIGDTPRPPVARKRRTRQKKQEEI
jgi:hypothetical protein